MIAPVIVLIRLLYLAAIFCSVSYLHVVCKFILLRYAQTRTRGPCARRAAVPAADCRRGAARSAPARGALALNLCSIGSTSVRSTEPTFTRYLLASYICLHCQIRLPFQSRLGIHHNCPSEPGETIFFLGFRQATHYTLHSSNMGTA
eukprot:3005878-Pleurochrysis_carterae.AAC.1